MIQFQISTRNSGRLRVVQVCIYDTPQELRAAGDRYSHRVEGPGHEKVGNDVHGLAQAVDREYYDGKRWRKMPDAGFIRLWKGALRTGIITHECTHMAWAIYQQDVQRTIPDMKREETLCYLVGDLSARLVNRLYAKGLL